MKVLFLGTPQFAVPSLTALLKSRHDVVGVVTQPDRALKRGRTEFCAVKQAAQDAGLFVFQPDSVRNHIDRVKSFGADIAVTAAYGQLLDEAFISAFKYGVINVHASLLPKYRGASPIYSAILAGEKTTGVTIMQTELGLDTGDILSVAETPIGDNENATSLTERLSVIGAELLIKTLDDFLNIKPVKQDDTAATKCRTVKKQQLFIDFAATADRVCNQIRALADVPGARTVIDGVMYKIFAATVATDIDGISAFSAGEIVKGEDRFTVACGDGAINVQKIQAPGKKVLDIADFLRGKKFKAGAVCGNGQDK